MYTQHPTLALKLFVLLTGNTIAQYLLPPADAADENLDDEEEGEGEEDRDGAPQLTLTLTSVVVSCAVQIQFEIGGSPLRKAQLTTT
eukprot:924923-Pyramimonas_sp.AAC.3